MTTPDFDFEMWLPYTLQLSTVGDTIALTIDDPKQRNRPGPSGHVLKQGTYLVQASYDGPGTCRIMTAGIPAFAKWSTRATIPAGTEGTIRSASATITVPYGQEYEVRLWADSTAGFTGSITVTKYPDYKK